jgi:predicted AlkP superfamily pyrophosphatase or phosphodiesterase
MKKYKNIFIFLICLIFALCSNLGFARQPVLLISIDGFRPDYLNKKNSPTLYKFAQQGVRALSLKPIFPSLTFPNHYTIVTGLYAEHHGIVGNEIRDPQDPKLHFTLGAPREVVNNPKWWLGEPIWITAQKQGLKSGILFWPGSEAPHQEMLPTYFQPYDQKITSKERVDLLLKWFDLPDDQRPQFFTLYFDTVDSNGHRFGPQSEEVKNAIKEVDAALSLLLSEVEKREKLKDLNILVVSDHGMVLMDPKKTIDISDILKDFPNVDKTGNSAVVGLFSSNKEEINQLQKKLIEKSKSYKVYKKENIPTRYHYQKSDRIPDLLLVAKEKVNIKTKVDFAPSKQSPYVATHGYDNTLKSMQASFFAKGPSFATQKVVPTLENVNLYELMCKILEIKPAPNDGKLSNLPKNLLR